MGAISPFEWVEIGTIGFGVLVWFVRLEGKLTYAQKQIDHLQIKHDALDSKVLDELARLREAIARIEGFLKSKGE